VIKKGWLFLFVGLSAALSGCSSGEGGSGTNEPVDACAPFMSESSVGEVEIVVRNDRAAPIYLRNDTCYSRFGIAPPGEKPHHVELTVLDVTCDEGRVRQSFPLDCFDEGVHAIEPGVTETFRWKGLFYDDVAMPASCYEKADESSIKPATCSQGLAATPGTLEVTVSLYANAMENCEVGCQSGIDPFEVKHPFVYPDETTVTIPIVP